MSTSRFSLSSLATVLILLQWSAAAHSQDGVGYHLLAIGVDHYAHKSVRDLVGCEADARELVKLFNSTNPPLLNAKATRQRILSELEALENSADGRRIFILTSGHGARRRGAWYFAPHDYDPLRPEETGVSDHEILARLAALIRDGRQVVLVLDACHAGQVYHCAERQGLFAPAKKGGPDRGGLILLAAANPSQFSIDGKSGGLFSRALLEGLNGIADQDEDGVVTIREVRRYLNHRVRQIVPGKFKAPGLPWPEQDPVCATSPTISENSPLLTVERKSKPKLQLLDGMTADGPYIVSVPREFASLVLFHEPVKKGDSSRVTGLWYHEEVIRKSDGSSLKQFYILEFRTNGTYSAVFKPAFGEASEARGWYTCEDGSQFVLDYGNGYDVLGSPEIREDLLKFDCVPTLWGQRLQGDHLSAQLDVREKDRARPYTFHRVRDWSEVEKRMNGR
jgi:caspase domain-containing protein